MFVSKGENIRKTGFLKKREMLKFLFGCAAPRIGRLYSPSGINNRFKATCH